MIVLGLVLSSTGARASFGTREDLGEPVALNIAREMLRTLVVGFFEVVTDAIEPSSTIGLRLRASIGDSDAMLALAGSLDDSDPGAQRYWLRRAADAGNSAAAIKLAALYYDAEDLLRRPNGEFFNRSDAAREASPDDQRQARAILAKAAKTDPNAMTLLATMTHAGIGAPPDPAEARRLYRQAGTRNAIWLLGKMTLLGDGGPPDPVAARVLFKASSDDGLVDGSYELARLTVSGIGGPKSAINARKLLTGVVEYCHGDGANDLARMAELGQGGPRDPELAATLYLKAVECHNEYFREPLLLTAPTTIGRSIRRRIQRHLRAGHSYEGPIDGIIGPASRKAIEALE